MAAATTTYHGYIKMKFLVAVLFVLLNSSFSVYAESLTYPNGAKKAVIFSYDDAAIQDRQFVKLLNKYHLIGTFNVNSGRLGKKALWLKDFIGKEGKFIDVEELSRLYKGHEVAGHSYSHPGLAGLESKELIKQIKRDKQILEPLLSQEVRSFAYPLGSYDEAAMSAVKQAGYSNARTTQDSNSFQLPEYFMAWHPTVHHSKAMTLVNEYVSLQAKQLTVMMIWGHSWEFDENKPNNNWQYIEALLKEIAHRDDIWYVSAGEFIGYIISLEKNK